MVVCSDAEFKGSVVDIAGGFVVGRNILMNDTNCSVGNILKEGVCFIHNFGTDNTFVGKEAGNFTMTGSGKNTGLGVQTLSSNTIGNSNTAVGREALASTTGSNNTAVGDNALSSSTAGNKNIGIGKNAGTNLTSGDDNIYIGSDSDAETESDTIRIDGLGSAA